jgi:hypothetical protein
LTNKFLEKVDCILSHSAYYNKEINVTIRKKTEDEIIKIIFIANAIPLNAT